MRISRRSFAAAVLLVIATVPSALEAQFAPSPPTGASNPSQTVTVDPNNPASATITTIDPLYGIFKIVDHYYYDCLKKKWVWVSRDWSKKSTAPFSSEEFTPAAPPKPEYASPSAKELPSGRPPGSETSPGDPDRAFNPTTGQNFAKQPDGSWIDVKTGKVAVAPKLCPCPEPATAPTPPKPARTTPPAQPKLDKTSSRILDIQNGERLAVGAPPLRWNETLAANATAYASELAHTGNMVHAPREGRGIERENLQKGLVGWTPDRMLQDWISEKRYFRAGIYPNVCTGDWSQCSHYTQMIWPTTTDVGCGMAPGGGFEWLVCRYSPGGNKDGKPVGQSVNRAPERG